MFHKVKNVFPLPEKDCYPLEILTDEAEENLFLLTSENKKAVLRIIDKETMTEKQKLELMDFNGILGHNGYEQQMDLHDEGIVIIINDDSFCFVTESDGIYKKQIVTNLGEGLGQSNEYLYDLAYQKLFKSFIANNFIWFFIGAIVLIVGIILLIVKSSKRDKAIIDHNRVVVAIHYLRCNVIKCG